MRARNHIVMLLRPSLRRAYFFTFLYVGALSVCRLKLALAVSHPAVLAAAAVLLLLLAYVHLARACMRYTLTKEQVNVDSGIIARKRDRIPLEKITDATEQQGLLERCLGLVNIYLETAGSTQNEACLLRILKHEAEEFSAQLRDLRNQKIAAPATAQ